MIQWNTEIEESLQIASLEGSFDWTKAADTNSTEGSIQRATEIDESGLLQIFLVREAPNRPLLLIPPQEPALSGDILRSISWDQSGSHWFNDDLDT